MVGLPTNEITGDDVCPTAQIDDSGAMPMSPFLVASDYDSSTCVVVENFCEGTRDCVDISKDIGSS